MSAVQSLEDIAAKRKKMLLAKVRDIWQSRLSIKFEEAKKVTDVAVEVSQKSFKWEAEYKVRGRGTDVIITLLFYYIFFLLYIHYNL